MKTTTRAAGSNFAKILSFQLQQSFEKEVTLLSYLNGTTKQKVQTGSCARKQFNENYIKTRKIQLWAISRGLNEVSSLSRADI